jgi:hypothetical protein
MQVGAPTEVVSVQGEAAQIDYDSHTIGGVITRQEIENLPLERPQLPEPGHAGAGRDRLRE